MESIKEMIEALSELAKDRKIDSVYASGMITFLKGISISRKDYMDLSIKEADIYDDIDDLIMNSIGDS